MGKRDAREDLTAFAAYFETPLSIPAAGRDELAAAQPRNRHGSCVALVDWRCTVSASPRCEAAALGRGDASDWGAPTTPRLPVARGCVFFRALPR